MTKLVCLVMATFLLNGCSWFDRAPSGSKTIEGTFIYDDFESVSDSTCVGADCPKGDIVVFRLKADRAFLVQIPTRVLIKSYYDKHKAIPYEGHFSAHVIYDSLNRVDYLRIDSMNDESVKLEVKAKDIN